MKKIICYGDSNTFGFNPKNGNRYDENTRWTGVLSHILSNEYEVKEEGCNNRTGFFENSDGVFQSGQIYLPQCLEKNKNFDIFIFALGTNDLQKFYTIDEKVVKEGLKNLISYINKINSGIRIILITPVLLNETALSGTFSYQFDKKSIELSFWIQDIYKNFAVENEIEMLNLNEFVVPSTIDGLHFEPKEHTIIAKVIAKQILNDVLVKNKLTNFI